jgi:hypothetical protein
MKREGAPKGASRTTAKKSVLSINPGSDGWQALVDSVNGCLVVVVRRPDDRQHRRCYFTVAAAQNAAARAAARSDTVEVFVGEIRPVYRIPAATRRERRVS